MRIGHILDTESIRHRYLESFKAEVEEKIEAYIDGKTEERPLATREDILSLIHIWWKCSVKTQSIYC